MQGLRKRKNEFRDQLYRLRDRFIQGIEEDVIHVATCKYGLEKFADIYHEFRQACERMDDEYKIYSEIEKQGRIQKELCRVEEDYEETVATVTVYMEREQAADAGEHGDEDGDGSDEDGDRDGDGLCVPFDERR